MMLNFQEKIPFEIFNIVDMSIQMQMIPFFEKKNNMKKFYTHRVKIGRFFCHYDFMSDQFC